MCDARGESNRIRIYVPPEDELYCMSDWVRVNMINSQVDKLEYGQFSGWQTWMDNVWDLWGSSRTVRSCKK